MQACCDAPVKIPLVFFDLGGFEDWQRLTCLVFSSEVVLEINAVLSCSHATFTALFISTHVYLYSVLCWLILAYIKIINLCFSLVLVCFIYICSVLHFDGGFVLIFCSIWFISEFLFCFVRAFMLLCFLFYPSNTLCIPQCPFLIFSNKYLQFECSHMHFKLAHLNFGLMFLIPSSQYFLILQCSFLIILNHLNQV